MPLIKKDRDILQLSNVGYTSSSAFNLEVVKAK